MDKKPSSSVCTISNICFEVVHKGKSSIRPQSQMHHSVHTTTKVKPCKVRLEGFIQNKFKNVRKQYENCFKYMRKDVKRLKGLDCYAKSFPVRKIITSHSQRHLLIKRQKCYDFGNYEPSLFSNSKLNALFKSEVKEKTQISQQFMTKSSIENFTSTRSSKSLCFKKILL